MKLWMGKEFREKFFTEVSTLPIASQSVIINEVHRDKEVRAVVCRNGSIMVELKGGAATYLLPATERFMRSFLEKHYPEILL